ncbi:MAG: hypothetical protein JO037_12480 [Actinobacteria bacterium]|nr:hypothetical protein [Actinomycetota bacterium]
MLARDGQPKALVPEFVAPTRFTGLTCVTRVYTDLPVFLIQPGRVVVRDVYGTDFSTLAALLDLPLTDGTQDPAS